MKRSTTLSLASVPVLLIASGAASAADSQPETTAHYKVIFERSWSGETHPDDFPLLAHFSPVIGATHDGSFALFAPNAAPTPGIEMLCEEGKHQPLDGEIEAAIGAGHVGALIETGDPIRDVPGQAVTEFEIDAAHPLVDIAAMIAPSPDWCAVAASVSLLEDGRFVPERSVELLAWDVGTDSATSYRAFDADTQPRGAMQLNDSPYFQRAGVPIPVGRVTFVRM